MSPHSVVCFNSVTLWFQTMFHFVSEISKSLKFAMAQFLKTWVWLKLKPRIFIFWTGTPRILEARLRGYFARLSKTQPC